MRRFFVWQQAVRTIECMKKWSNNLSFALWMTALLATGTAFAQTHNAAASAASVAAAASLPIRFDPQRAAAEHMAATCAFGIAQGKRELLDADGKQLQSQGTIKLDSGNSDNKPKVLQFLAQHASGTDK